MTRDMNDVLQDEGDVGVRALSDAARPWHETVRAAANLEFADEIEISTKVDDIVKGVLPRGATAVLYAPTGAGKTFVGLDLGFHAALGHDWHGHRVPTAIPVLYVGLEGVPGLKHRIVADRNELGDPGKMFARLTLSVLLNSSEAGAAGQAEIIGAAKVLGTLAGQPVGLIIVDTVARAMAGDDESSTRDMSGFIARLDTIARETGATVLGIHHPGKDEHRGMRGAYALGAGCDVVLKIEVQGDTRTVATEKVRDGAIGKLFAFKLRPIVLGTDDDGDSIVSCIVMPSEAATDGAHRPVKGRPPKQATAALQLLRKAINESPVTAPASNHIPPNARTTTLTEYKRYFVLGTVTESDKPDTKQKAFVRACQALQNAEFMGKWEDYVWLTDKSDRTGQK